MDVKIPGVQLLEKIDQGDPIKGTDLFEASDQHYQKQFMESFSSTKHSKLEDDRAWSSQEWKAEASTYDRSGRPDKTSWNAMQPVRPHHEDALLDGTEQSVRYGETLRDRSGRPDNINSQEVASSQIFVMGNEETELELSVESTSFVNRVNDQMRKRQKRISNVAGDGEEHSIILENVYGCNDGISDIHGKEFPKQSEFHYEYNRSYTEANVRHICEISGRTR